MASFVYKHQPSRVLLRVNTRGIVFGFELLENMIHTVEYFERNFETFNVRIQPIYMRRVRRL